MKSGEEGHRRCKQPSTTNSATFGQFHMTSHPPLVWPALCPGPWPGWGAPREDTAPSPRGDRHLTFQTDTRKPLQQLTVLQSPVEDLRRAPGMGAGTEPSHGRDPPPSCPGARNAPRACSRNPLLRLLQGAVRCRHVL